MGRKRVLVAGVDGCKGGWVCFMVDLNSRKTALRFFHTFAHLVRQSPRPKVIAVDIPIGLPDSGPRECDKAARRLLGKPRSNSIFPAPIRPLLKARSYGEALRISRKLQRKGISKQSYAILGKVREVDAIMTAKKQKTIREVHPEACFWALNEARAMKYRKSKQDGQNERRALLEKHYAGMDAHVDNVRGKCKIDDLLDAVAAAWTAERIIRGKHRSVCLSEPDRKGLQMEMVY